MIEGEGMKLSAVPKEYFGYDEENKTHAWHKQLMADRYCDYAFLKSLLALSYCWAHARRVCQEFGWINAAGKLKTMSCKVALLRMHRAGLIALPAPGWWPDATASSAGPTRSVAPTCIWWSTTTAF